MPELNSRPNRASFQIYKTSVEDRMLDLKGNRITYFGHSTFSLTTPSGQVALIDPWLKTNPMCPEAWKNVPRLDVIFLTHAHDDHSMDLLELAKQHQPKLVTNFETYLWLTAKGFEKECAPMGKGGSQTVGEFDVTMTHAFHSNSIDEGGARLNAGEPGSYVIRMPGGLTIFHAGDTAVFGDMKLIGELYKPELAMLPIGDRWTMGPREAAYAIKLLSVKHVIPMHYATFPMLTGTVEGLQQETREIAELTIHALKPGESL
jgi:L-ascorbate metabolism protein UlaG (beta-lactamase superfamily)